MTDDFLHQWFAADRVIAGYILGELRGRLSSDGRMRKRKAQCGHAFFYGLVCDEVDECVDDDSNRRNTVVGFDFSNVADDRRRAGASVAYGHDHQAVFGLNLTP